MMSAEIYLTLSSSPVSSARGPHFLRLSVGQNVRMTVMTEFLRMQSKHSVQPLSSSSYVDDIVAFSRKLEIEK